MRALVFSRGSSARPRGTFLSSRLRFPSRLATYHVRLRCSFSHALVFPRGSPQRQTHPTLAHTSAEGLASHHSHGRMAAVGLSPVSTSARAFRQYSRLPLLLVQLRVALTASVLGRAKCGIARGVHNGAPHDHGAALGMHHRPPSSCLTSRSSADTSCVAMAARWPKAFIVQPRAAA